ncbi:MAG: hypothetical protein WD824_10160 [Cyclobacteriaceae bacterium]
MAMLLHQNIKVLEKALQWRRNGVLSYIASDLTTWISLNVPQTDATRLGLALSPLKG